MIGGNCAPAAGNLLTHPLILLIWSMSNIFSAQGLYLHKLLMPAITAQFQNCNFLTNYLDQATMLCSPSDLFSFNVVQWMHLQWYLCTRYALWEEQNRLGLWFNWTGLSRDTRRNPTLPYMTEPRIWPTQVYDASNPSRISLAIVSPSRISVYYVC